MATRDSRVSIDSGFSDDKQIRKHKHKRSRNKSKQRRKFCKDDIGKPLPESYNHMAHIGMSGDCFGEISADMTKVAVIGDQKSTHSAMLVRSGTSFHRTVSESATTDVEVRLRPHIVPPMVRHSVMSWNLEFDHVDILESVLAVMDQLNGDRHEDNEIFEVSMNNQIPPTPTSSAMSANTQSAPDEPIYDQVPRPGSEPQLVQRTETILERVNISSSSRPTFRPPPPVPDQEEVIYDFVGTPGSVAKFRYEL